MIKFILLGILLVFTVHQAFAENVTMTTDSSEFYFLVGENVAVETIVNSSFPNTLTGDIEYTTVITVQQPGLQTVNTNVGNSPVAINPGVEQLLIQFGSYQTETTLQTTLHVTYSDVQEYELIHDFTVHIVADDSQQNNQNDPSQSSSQQSQSQQQQQQSQQQQQQQHNNNNSNNSNSSSSSKAKAHKHEIHYHKRCHQSYKTTNFHKIVELCGKNSKTMLNNPSRLNSNFKKSCSKMKLLKN